MMSFDVRARDGVPGLRAAVLVFGGLMVALVAKGCVVVGPDPNYCAHATGDFFCAHHYGSGGPSFCVMPSGTCLAPFADVIEGNPEFDGCVATRPTDDACYSPCGNGKTFVEESGCREDATGTEADTGMTTVVPAYTESTGETLGVDGSTTLGMETTAEGTTDATSTTGSTSTGESGRECLTPGSTMSWGGCLTELNAVALGLCNAGGDAACVLTGMAPTVTHSTCAVPCVDMDPCSCPESPVSGTASVACGDIDDGPGDDPYLDCSGDAVCPDGMDCVDDRYCATPAEPAPMYGDCIAGCALPGECASTRDGHRVCVTPCFDGKSCADNPEPMGMSAVPTCGGAIAPPIGEECYLACQAYMIALSCPEGMNCVAPDSTWPLPGTYQSICMWPAS
jgi:hypothetical protein